MIYSKKYIEYDFTFLKEITELIIKNLTELTESLSKCSSYEVKQCAKSFCRSKITLTLIGNASLLVNAEKLVGILKVKPLSKVDPAFVETFQKLCSLELKILSSRIIYYESYLTRTPKLG